MSSEQPPPSFYSVGGAKARSCPLVQQRVRGRGSAPTPTSTHEAKLQAPWSPATCPRPEGNETQTHMSAPACPISPHPHSNHLPGHTGLSRSTSSTLPDGKFWRHSSVLPISSLLGQECPALGLAHSRGLGWMDRGEKRNPAPSMPLASLQCGHNSESVTPSFICNGRRTGLDLGSPCQGLWTP